MNREILDLIEKKKKELDAKRDRPFGTLWRVTFFLEDGEVVPLKILLNDIDTLIESIGDSRFINLETWDSKAIINTEKILYVLIREGDVS